MQENLASSKNDDSLLDAKKAKKKLEMKNYFSKGTYVDAKDSMSNWCVGQIIDLSTESDFIKVRFDGWSSKWNEGYKSTSAKIAPFRKFSRGSL